MGKKSPKYKKSQDDLFYALDSTLTNSQRGSYETENLPLPLNYIVFLVGTFSDQNYINFIFEYLPGQDLYWIIQNKFNMVISKSQKDNYIKFYSSQVLCALETLQRHNIIYRDIKPENIMIDKEGCIKLIDFGFSKVLIAQSGYRTSTNCGTLGYNAPEVLMNHHTGYGLPADIWSFGILLCELIGGGLPYNDIEDPMRIQQQTLHGDVKLPRDIDQSTRDLLNCIFNVDPNSRISIKDIMKKPFFKDTIWQRVRNR